jgi:hypothetical protein
MQFIAELTLLFGGLHALLQRYHDDSQAEMTKRRVENGEMLDDNLLDDGKYDTWVIIPISWVFASFYTHILAQLQTIELTRRRPQVRVSFRNAAHG